MQFKYGNRIIMMDEGRIIADIPLEKRKISKWKI
jgi:ABC-type uncharacterized transport system ATPase component